MLENFKKLNNGRIRVKLIAAMLAIILTFANFTFLGSYIGKRVYATDGELSNQDDTTNNSNVKFEAYLDVSDKSVKEQTADINSEEVKLYIAVNVQNEGYLQNTKVELLSTNFAIKGNEQVTEIPLDTIETDNGITLEIPVVAISNSIYNLGLLSMISQIKLTGEYINNKGEVTDIETVKEVKITWETDKITKDDLLLSQEVITNKIYTINGENKRVIQVLVKSSVAENKVPVKQTNLEISIPQIGVAPEEVTVASYTTKATNGGTGIEFADLETSSWSYSEETGKINVSITNPADEYGNISWVKNVEDEIIVTYIYNEETEVEPFVSNVKSTLEIYGAENNTTLNQTSSLTIDELQSIGNIVDIENTITAQIYKGNLYIGEGEDYTSTYNIYVSYKELANNIKIEDLGDEGVTTYYKETKINRAEAISVLGLSGVIEIYNAENNVLLQTINLSEQEEVDYIVVEYGEGISKVLIQTSAAQKEGKIEVINQKEIKVSAQDTISEISSLTSNVRLLVTDKNGNTVTKTSASATAEVLEPTTVYNITLDKTSLVTSSENELQITVELKTENSSNKLFSNPEIRIELPAEITDAEIENISQVLHSDELSLEDYDIVTNESGNKEIVIVVKGSQTKYEQNPCIVIDLKLKTDSFMASKDVSINTTCKNGEDSIICANNILLVSKTGFVTKNTITVDDDVVEKINENTVEELITENSNVAISSKIINNFGETLSNISIEGTIANEMTLTEQITTNIEGAEIYYATEENAQNWVLEVENLSTVKAFKIVLPGNIEQGSLIEINYKVLAEIENITENTEIINNININYEINEQTKRETIQYIIYALVEDYGISLMSLNEADVVAEAVEITMSPKAMTDTLYQGQIVTYEITVTNTGTEDLISPQLIYTVPENAVVTELTYSQGTEITYTDSNISSKTWTIEKLGAGKSVTVEITLRIKDNATSITNNAVVQNASGDTINTYSKITGVIAGELNVMLSRRANYISTVTEGETIQSVVMITNNTSSAMTNLTITSKLPEGTAWIEDSEYNTSWTYDAQTGEISYNLASLAVGETTDIRFKIKVDAINNETYEDVIDNMVLVTTSDGTEYASNVYTSTAIKAYWSISMTSESSETLQKGDSVKYIITVTNIGKRSGIFTLIDEIPEELYINSVTYYIEGVSDDYKTTKYPSDNNIQISYYAEIGKTVIIEIECTVLVADDTLTSEQITNTAKIDVGDDEYIESNSIVNTIVKSSTDIEDDDEKDQDNTIEDENGTYSISGTAWLDADKDGTRTSSEEVMQLLRVVLLDTEGNVLDETLTSLTGTYKFTGLSAGKYLVAIVYDTDKYTVTKYQVSTAGEDTNSNVFAKTITLDDKSTLVGITDTITIDNANITNIDMGLIENPVFDLSLSKYISKVVVTTSSGTSTYEYEEPTNLAKVEISAKEISGSVLLVEYEIKVSNEGDVDGFVTDIIDYMPSELTFNSELNSEWYLGTDNYLHYIALNPEAIAPGESQTVKLILTRNLKSNSTGTIQNVAEIGASTNLEGIIELDSVAGNNQTGEDDISTAELIVSIKTGGQGLYIGIVIASMLALGIGIYIINKKVLRVRI